MSLLEGQQDRDAEQYIITEITKRIPNSQYRKLKLNYIVDYAVYQGSKMYAWVECRRRHINSTDYPDIILSLAKWNHGKRLHELTNKPFIFAVQFNDGIKVANLSSGSYEVSLAGNKGRHRSADIEPCISIPVSEFKSL
jgi:hypothetical protein